MAAPSEGADPFRDLLPPPAQGSGAARPAGFGSDDVLVSPPGSAEGEGQRQGGTPRAGPPMVRLGGAAGAAAARWRGGWGRPGVSRSRSRAGRGALPGPPQPLAQAPPLLLPLPVQRKDAGKDLEGLAAGAAERAVARLGEALQRSLEEVIR